MALATATNGDIEAYKAELLARPPHCSISCCQQQAMCTSADEQGCMTSKKRPQVPHMRSSLTAGGPALPTVNHDVTGGGGAQSRPPGPVRAYLARGLMQQFFRPLRPWEAASIVCGDWRTMSLLRTQAFIAQLQQAEVTVNGSQGWSGAWHRNNAS